MTSSVSGAGFVKSWPGLAFGVLGVVVSLAAWFESGSWAYLVSAAGLACFAIVWSKLPLSFRAPLRAQLAGVRELGRVDTALSWLGLALVGLAIVLRWLP
jgi:hypothetical protein